MNERLRLLSGLFAISFALTACGGGGGSSFSSGSPGSGSPGGGANSTSGSRNISITLKIPSSSASGSSIVRTAASAIRKPATVSSQTASISVSVNGGTPQIFNASPPTCTGSPLTCTLSVGATYGLDSFLIITYSGPNATGTALNAAAVTINVSASGPNSAAATAGNIITVNDSADGSGAGFSCAGGTTTCTLREAVAEASTTVGTVTAIMFNGVGTIVLTQNSAIQIASGQSIEILGPGASATNTAGAGAPSASSGVTISGGGQTQLFYVNTGGSFTVDGVELTGGNSSDNYGGAIENYGVLAIINTILSGNGGTHTSYGGAVYDETNGNYPSSIVASTFTNNTSLEYGGAYYVEEFGTNTEGGASFERDLFTNNTAFDGSNYGEGGAIYADWNLYVDASTFTGNVAGSSSVSGVQGYGGAITLEYNDTSPTITNSTFGGSTASAGNFAGSPGSASATSDAEGGAIYNDADYPLVLNGNTFSNNVARNGYQSFGGAISDYEGIISTGDTFTNNLADSSLGTSLFAGFASGGAVYSDFDTSWTSDTFTGNQALGGVDALGEIYGEAYGGAIDNDESDDANFIASQTTFTKNSAISSLTCEGGAVWVYYNSSSIPVSLTNVQFTNNSCSASATGKPSSAYGGGLYAEYSPISFSNVTFSGNTASATSTLNKAVAAGGGFEYYNGFYGCIVDCSVVRQAPPGPTATFFSTAAADIAQTQSADQVRRAQTFSNIQTLRSRHANGKAKRGVRPVIHNRVSMAASRKAQSSGPANGMSNVTFTGNTVAITVNGSISYALGGGADLSGQPTLTATTFTGNTAIESGSNGHAMGGGFSYGGETCGENLTFTGTVTGNLATDAGGGIFNNGCFNFTVTNSTLSGNRVTNAQYLGDGGGGLTNYNGSMQLSQSTVNGNTVAASTPVAGSGGGGIMNYNGSLVVTNATIVGNQSAIDGGGIENGAGCCEGLLALVNLTIYQNTALGAGGSLNNQNASGNNFMPIQGTIFAGGSAPTGAEIANFDTIGSKGGNLIQGSTSGNAIPTPNPSFGPPDLLGVDPKLASGLANNGGPTQTIADTSSSPGKGYIPFAIGQCGDEGPSVDQRNFTRGANGFCDIGAYELSGVASTIPASTTRAQATFRRH